MYSDSAPSTSKVLVTAPMDTNKSLSSRLRLSRTAGVSNKQQEQHQDLKGQPTQQTHQRPLYGLSSTSPTPTCRATNVYDNLKQLQAHLPGPSQHPSHYPISAIQALQQAGIAQSPRLAASSAYTPRSHLQERSSYEAGPSRSSTGSASKAVAAAAAATSVSRSPSPFPSTASPSVSAPFTFNNTPSTSEPPSSGCSDSSSEFSLASALPNGNGEEKRRATTREELMGKDKKQAAESNWATASHPPSNYSDRSDSIVPPTDLSVPTKAKKGKPAVKGEDWDQEELQSSPMPKALPVGKRPGKTIVKAIRRNNIASSVALEPSSETGEILFRPRLRTITMASQTTTTKSPPPPLQKRKMRTVIPPSPITPRQPARVLQDGQRSAQEGREERESPLEEEVKSKLLQVTRPPRSTRRSPTPLSTASQETPSGAYHIEDEGDRYDEFEGERWEMLNSYPTETKGKREQGEGKAVVGSKWSTIESWRTHAGDGSDAMKGEAEDESWKQDGRVGEGGRGSSKAGPSLLPALPTMNSGLSFTTMQSFQSMSSMAPSVVTAVAEAPLSPFVRTNERLVFPPSTPATTSEHRPMERRQSPANAPLPGTFPGLASSHSLAEVFKHPVSRFAAGAPQSTGESTTGRRENGSTHSPSCTLVSSLSSDKFESADEGEGHSPTRRKNQQYSPRVRLSRQYNAQKRASRMIGAKVNPAMDEGDSSKQTKYSLTTAQLVALSEEAESGLLDAAELRQRHEYLLSTEEDTLRGEEQPADCLPTPELWRQSTTSKEEDTVATPESASWADCAKEREERMGLLPDGMGLSVYRTNESGLQAAMDSITVQHLPKASLASPLPVRPLARRRSKRFSSTRGNGEETLSKPATATFVKLSSLPIQLVEAPVPISWRSRLSVLEYEELASTFGSKEMHRQEVIEELCVTEWNFVASLSSILRVFSLPLRNNDYTFLGFVPLEVARLFNWLDEILGFHVKLLKSLDKVRDRHPSPLVVSVADSVLKHVEGLSIHQSYLVNFDRVTKLIDDIRRSESKDDLGQFDEVIERQSRLPECRGMGLSSFLLKPVQRLMKYPLFFKQLAELTPWDHPDCLATAQLCSATEKAIRDMNCVKAREEDYRELQSLSSKIRGLPEDFHLASRQRRLIKQGPLRSLNCPGNDRPSQLDRNISAASSTTTSPRMRPIGLAANGYSPVLSTVSVPPSNDRVSQFSLQSTPSIYSAQSPSLSDASCGASFGDARTTISSFSSMTVSPKGPIPASVEMRRVLSAQPAPTRPASRKQSMANLFSRSHSYSNSNSNGHNNSSGQGKAQVNEVDEETALHAFLFDDLLLLTTLDRDEESAKSGGKQFLSKKKQTSSPNLVQSCDDTLRYTVLPKCGVSRILGVSCRAGRGGMSSTPLQLEVDLLPLSKAGEGARASGSAGIFTFLFTFDEGGAKGLGVGQEACMLWKKAMEKSFLSCIQARKRQSTHCHNDLSSPIFGVLTRQRGGVPTGSLNTAQADWPRRKEHVSQMVMNSARCGDRTTLTALLQAGLPFPRSPSQQNLSDMACRTVATVELASQGKGRGLGTLAVQKSPSQGQGLPRSSLGSGTGAASSKRPFTTTSSSTPANVDEIARMADLGSPAIATQIMDEERKEEKTWWSLRLKEVEMEGEWIDELDKMIGSRRSRVEDAAPYRPGSSASSVITSISATRVRKGLPVLKAMDR